MIDASNNVDSFKYQKLSIFVLVFSLLVFFFVAFSILSGIKYGGMSGVIVFLTFVPFFSFLGVLTALGFSDVIVNDDGVSRKLYGWTWKSVSWSDIESIRVFNVRVASTEGFQTVLKVIQKEIPVSKSRIKNITISKDMDMSGRFIKKMNDGIEKYGIQVEVESSGILVKSDRLS